LNDIQFILPLFNSYISLIAVLIFFNSGRMKAPTIFMN
jgi:hypothetical protein